jgi:ParB-like chromosome segregation protein Spo0J
MSEDTVAAVTRLVPVAKIVADAEQLARHERVPKKHGRLMGDMGRNGQYTAIGVLEGGMQCIFGHGRLLAAIKLGWTHILARVFPASLTPAQVGIVRWGENEFRSGLTPFERYRQCQQILDSDSSLKAHDLAQLLGLTDGGMVRVMAIGKVEPVFQEALQARTLTQEDIYKISRLESKDRFEYLAAKRGTADARLRKSSEPPRPVRRPKGPPAAAKSRITIPVAGSTVNVCGLLPDMPALTRALESALEEVRIAGSDCDMKCFARLQREKKGGEPCNGQPANP